MGHPIRLREPERAAHLITIYAVQVYWFDGRRAARGALKECPTEEKAIALGRRLARRHYAVLAFSVVGNPEADYWAAPRVLEVHGPAPLFG